MNLTKGFLDFLESSKSSFHAVNNVKNILDKNGFIELFENKPFNLEKGKSYYLTRNLSSIIAFKIPEAIDNIGFNITAAHTDSPTFKLKPNALMSKDNYYLLNTEVYGGPIYNTFLDRPLDIVGRVIVKEKGKITAKLLSFDKGMCVIPNLAIHYQRNVNDGVKLNPQIELLPILSDINNGLFTLEDLIAKKLNIDAGAILSYDLYLAILDRGSIVGANNEFIMAPQIDNLECSYILTNSLIDSKAKAIDVMVLFDSEEIGSRTRAGASGDLLKVTLDRILESLNIKGEDKYIAYSNSFMISADNAQGYHPLYSGKYDPTCSCYLNRGIAIKSAAKGSYTSDSYTLSIFKEICDSVDSKYQMMTNRSDIPGGSTLGALSLEQISIPTVDIGLPQLAMHSAMETAGSFDLEYMYKAIKKFYSIKLESLGDSNIKIGG